jgi:acyl-CoA synthetase (AMP-forming)/AMP-acid ligase II
MPLFHIHGLIAGVLAPLAAGSQVFCTPGFNALKFFGWMDEARPTWYTAVPTMHQAIMARVPARTWTSSRATRCASCAAASSSMPPQVIKELEEIFKAPLIEAYGMTEATHQMASNPLPPAVRKPGSVGLPPAPRWPSWVKTAAAAARRGRRDRDPRRQRHRRLREQPKANAEAFTNGWFRTGDQGRWTPTATSA